MNKTHRSEGNQYRNDTAYVEEFSKSLEQNCKYQRDGQEYPDHGSLLLNKRNIPNLLIIRNASVEHVLGERRAYVAKSSGGAAHFLAIGCDHPLRGRDAASEGAYNYNRDNYFVHRKLLLDKAALTTRILKPLLATCQIRVT
jgi:hypothetical protein